MGTMRGGPRTLASCLSLASVLAASPAAAQRDAIAVDMTGIELRWRAFEGWRDQERNSVDHPFPPGEPLRIKPAAGYRYAIQDTLLTGTRLFGAILDQFDEKTLDNLLDYFNPGVSIVLRGHVRNQAATFPVTIWRQTFAGEVIGLEVSMTAEANLNADGSATLRIFDIRIPLGGLAGELRFTRGNAAIEVWNPSPRQQTEWHMEGAFDPAQGSASAVLRYLDDPAFAPLLGGFGRLTEPDGSMPTDVTRRQSRFATTASLGIAGPGGKDDTVYVTSPARNLETREPDHSRGIGLALAPLTRPTFPGPILFQWTLIADVYIPASSWYEDFPNNTRPREFPLALLQDSDNNDDDALVMIYNDPVRGPTIGLGSVYDETNYIATDRLRPDRWMRIAVAAGRTPGQTRVHIDGVLVGTSGSDWLYALTDPGAPLYGDGEPIRPEDWDRWGRYPNPWALSSGTFGKSKLPTAINGGLSLFADMGELPGLGGRSEVAYIANLYFADEALDDAEVAALGGPDADGIVLRRTRCYADCDENGRLDIRDFFCFQGRYAGGDTRADCDRNGRLDIRDFFCFQSAFAAGCR